MVVFCVFKTLTNDCINVAPSEYIKVAQAIQRKKKLSLCKNLPKIIVV
jgi:hypothetical protein